MGLWQDIQSDYQWYRTIEGGQRESPLRQSGFWIVANYRFGSWARGLRDPLTGQLARMLYALTSLAVSTITGAIIRPGAVIGRRFTIHTTQGLLITNQVRMGDDCTVNTGVCIVHRANQRRSGVATIGNHVTVGVGAKILGAVTIGDGAVIGANAVVLKDVPAQCLAVGVPAAIKPRL